MADKPKFPDEAMPWLSPLMAAVASTFGHYASHSIVGRALVIGTALTIGCVILEAWRIRHWPEVFDSRGRTRTFLRLAVLPGALCAVISVVVDLGMDRWWPVSG